MDTGLMIRKIHNGCGRGAHNIDNTADKKYYGPREGFCGDVTGDGVDDLALVYDYEGYSSGYGYAVIVAGDRNLVSVQDENPASVPSSLKVEAYPNPFNPTTKIKYTLTTQGLVTLSIVSVSGELIEKRELGEDIPGSYEEEINLGQHPVSILQRSPSRLVPK